MVLDNELDSDSIENETFAEYLSILAENPETYYRQDLMQRIYRP
jgi:hypothetical protein